eukprot:m.149713 g.149713  ORF g.149713 m.149713 type:complete len:88 (+) comp38532_c0_seq1:616-879(+)
MNVFLGRTTVMKMQRALTDGFTCKCQSGFFGNGKICNSCPDGYTYNNAVTKCSTPPAIGTMHDGNARVTAGTSFHSRTKKNMTLCRL